MVPGLTARIMDMSGCQMLVPGFTPYSTNGYWVFTNEGWTWVSDYSWG